MDAEVLKGIAVDGGGYILANGRIIKAPPQGPYNQLVLAIVKQINSSGHLNGIPANRMHQEFMEAELFKINRK